MISKFQKIKGTYDILPPEIEKWSQATSILQSISKQFGYEEIKTPIIENIDLFKQNIGYDTDVSKEMFTWEDSSKNQLVLKPEMTAPVVRAFIESGFFRSKPLCKLFYIDALFRREKPQKGRQRQFHQFGIEALGSSEIEQDVEVILLSRNSSDTGLRIFNSIEKNGLDISRAVFSGGESPFPYVDALDIDLFLSADVKDVKLSLIHI